MPGNEFGERIHNFFGQEGISQDQHQSQVVGGSWSSLSSGLVGNQIANLKSYSTQQSADSERRQSSNSQHGLTLTQQPIRSQNSRSLFQEHQQPTNGYMHGNLVLQASPNESNFLGVDADSSGDKLLARGFTQDFHKNTMRSEMGESPVNYDFFGRQQHLNSQLPNMLQPFPRQQMTFNDMQLLKQQVMVKQIQEYQMQQQQLEARQLNSLNSNAVNENCSSDSQSHPLINGIPLQDASSNFWQPDLMAGNTNLMHCDISSGVQGSSSGLMITPEHGQANILAAKFEPSLFGMPVSGANAPQNAFSSVQMNNLAAGYGSANKSSSLINQPTSFLNQSDAQDCHILPRSTYQEKVLFSHTPVPGSNNRPSFEHFQQDYSRERNISVQEKFGQMEGSGLSEKSFKKVPENINALQKSTTLDPTEEKILFGSDDNLWDAFRNSNEMSLTANLMSSSSDLYDACPSLQSGSWSALMQSAVAETSSDDAGVHEWGSKQQSVWANNNAGPHANSHIGNRAPNAPNERVSSDTTRTAVQHAQDRGNQFSDHGLLDKPMTQHFQMAENIFHPSNAGIDGHNNSWSGQQNEKIEDRVGIWKAASNPNFAALTEQKNQFAQNLQMQRESYGFGIASAGNDSSTSRGVQENKQSKDSSQILESYASNNSGSKDLVNAHDLSMHGGKETQTGHLGCRTSIPRRFQYHPMGNIDVTDEPCQEKVSHFGLSKSLGQPDMNTRIDKGHVSQNELNCANEDFKGMGSENPRTASALADRSGDRCNQVKSDSLRLELLHKVDQSQEHSGISEEKTSAEYGGQFRHSPSSASHGFSLQLAPPSQPAPSLDSMHFSQNSLQPLNSLHTVPQKGGTSQARFAPWASNQSFSQQSTYQGPFLGGNNHTSGIPYSKGYDHNQLMPVASRQSCTSHFFNSSSELSTPHVKDRNESSDIDQHGQPAETPSLLNPTSAEGFPSQPLVASSSSQSRSSSGMMSESVVGISASQHRFWNEPSKPQPDIKQPHPLPSNNIEGSFVRQEKVDQLSSQNGGDMSLGGRGMVMHELQSKDMGAKQTSEVVSMFSEMVQSNLQTFDRPLPSNNLPRDSLHHDEHMAGSRDGNVPKMTVKRVEDIAFKNRLVQSVNETGRFTPLKIEKQSSNVASSVDGSHSVQLTKQFNKQPMLGSTPGVETLSFDSLPSGATDKNLKVEKPKKRRTATSELLSWNEEVTQSPQRLKTLSETEFDWARATKRFAEKVEFETSLEDIPPIKSKRRLIYTTQLMQQLFRPPPARVISLVANSNYEFVAYTAARAALGDACSSNDERFSPANCSNPLSEKTKTEKISDEYISKAAEDFISRTHKLETDFARLENGTTVSDLRVEVDDLEKFAVINRFARFHPPPPSSSMDRTASSFRLNPQRYVTVASMPRHIPDRVQCLSL